MSPAASRSRALQRGISLVELMIALVVGLLLIAGVLQVFVSVQQSYRVQDAVARLQERGRIGLELIGRELRRTDYWGCLDSNGRLVNNLNRSSSAYSADLHDFAQGFVATSSSLTARRVQPQAISVEPPYMPVDAAALHVTAGNGLAQGDIVLVSDCDRGAVFQVMNASPSRSGTLTHQVATAPTEGPGNSSKPLPKSFGRDQPAYVYRAISRGFQLDTSEPLGERSLRDEQGMPLIEGVEQMALWLGEDTDGDGSVDRYLPPDQIGDMERVVSVQVELLLYSEDALLPEPAAYRFDGVLYDGRSEPGSGPLPGDRRLRRSYRATFALRNRLE